MQLLPTRLRKVTLAATVLAAACGTVASGVTNAYAVGVVSGTNGIMTITQSDGVTPMNAGGSQTAFDIALLNSQGKPAADCSADSATGSTFVYSYAVHQTVDPTILNYTSGHPSASGASYGSTAYGLFQSPNGTYYGGQTTAPGTGQVLTVGLSFQWNPPVGSTRAASLLYNAGQASSWNVGIACWNSATSVVTDNWNAVIVFSPSSTDPGGYTWTVVQPSQPIPSVGG